jgi:beta-fructofuranosidase
MELAQRENESRLLEQRLSLTRQWQHDLRSYLLKHYWVTSKTVQVLRRSNMATISTKTSSTCSPR